MAPWTHLPLVQAPFADFTWRHARQVLADRGCDNTDEAAVARVLAEVLNRAGNAASHQITARTQAALAAAGRPELDSPPADQDIDPDLDEADEDAANDETVQPFGVFDPTSEEHELW
jgi:hypothetical protein